MKTYLVTHGKTRFWLRLGETVVGRSPYCGIFLQSKLVSREHAVFRTCADGSLEVQDLGSRNGTLVNGRRLSGAKTLVSGDAVSIGPYSLGIELDVERDGAESATAMARLKSTDSEDWDGPTREEVDVDSYARLHSGMRVKPGSPP